MIKGRMVYIGGPSAMKRGLGPIVKDALQDAGGLWHRRYLPEHFRPGAATKYGYALRGAAYVDRKARGGIRPKLRRKPKAQRRRYGVGVRRPPSGRKIDPKALVYRGDLKRELTRRAVLSGTSKRVRVVMDVGQAWYGAAFFRKRNAPDMPAEITATTDAEVQRMAAIVEQYTARKLNEIQTRETRA